ncbi:DNA polymerase nu [Megalops cyprinoides]|uniref:DNA polymerase nu n=1 Tax=Megalops cyprinoides TaxID=118141 RepID=UPI001863A038|nr:DNA polymerase nu [Megalops cyprinoides]
MGVARHAGTFPPEPPAPCQKGCRNGERDPVSASRFSLRTPQGKQAEVGGRIPAVEPDRAETHSEGAALRGEGGAKVCLPCSDITREGTGGAEEHSERERVGQGDCDSHRSKTGPRGCQWQFGKHLLLPQNHMTTEDRWEGSESGQAKGLGKDQDRGCSGGAWSVRGLACPLLGDSVTQGGDQAESSIQRLLPQGLRFGQLQQPVRAGVAEAEEASLCRQGPLSDTGSYTVQRGVQHVRMDPAWSYTGLDDPGGLCWAAGRKQAGDQAMDYNEAQPGGYREDRARGHNEAQPGGYREDRARGQNEAQPGGYREDRARGQNEAQPGGYREDRARGQNEAQPGGYREDRARGQNEAQSGGYREDRARGQNEAQSGGYREDRARGQNEAQPGGYREGSERDGHSEKRKRRRNSVDLEEEQSTPEPPGAPAVCSWHKERHIERHPEGGVSTKECIDPSPNSAASGGNTECNSEVSSSGLKSHLNLGLEDPLSAGESCTPLPVIELTSTGPIHVPSPTNLLPTEGSQSPFRPDSTGGATAGDVPLKRRCSSPPPKNSAPRKTGRWEPPRPSQGDHRTRGQLEGSRGVPETTRALRPSPARKPSLHRTDREAPNIHRSEMRMTVPLTQKPPQREGSGWAGGEQGDPLNLREQGVGRGGAKTPKPLKQERVAGEVPELPKSSSVISSDPAVRDVARLSQEERAQLLQEAEQAEALVLTMVYQDGSTQLSPKQKASPSVSGILVLLKREVGVTEPQEGPGLAGSLIYLRLEQRLAWAQQEPDQTQDLFTREVVLRVVCGAQLAVCYKTKDLLRTLLQHFGRELSWKQVAQCRIQDPQIAAWLLDPANPASCFQDLVTKQWGAPSDPPVHPPPRKVRASSPLSAVFRNLCQLYRLMAELRSSLQTQGLWELFSNVELCMIPVLAAMESHQIHVDREALKRTSEMLGAKLKQLEQDAHKAAGQQFLVSSSAQLRLVLFEKLRLQERCDSRKLPRTVLKQQQSTSETALLQLQDLHPLPKIILEYRQVHKIKSTFVDGILSCMKKTFISSTWNQTSTVSGRLSAKQPNFQALPRQPVQISKKQHIQGKDPETVAVHPRDMFVSREGWTFVAADFCQVELRLLAHLTSDPELLRLFQDPTADVFTMLASQWKGVPEEALSPEDREHAKRIVYSVVYGAGRERLSGILGVSAEQASRFVESFLQRYREVQSFVQRTVQQCRTQGYVVSVMGRRRSLPHIHSPDWGVRNQAERQAVNFVVQASAADLCKMAMIRIFSLVSSSPSLTARLVAQIHDELLFEVEDSQVEDFAALVKTSMESLQHIDSLGVHLKVPLKVVVSSGRSWGSMSELRLPPAPPPPSL